MAKCKNCKNLYCAEVVFKHGTSAIPWCSVDDEDIEDIGEERECFNFECMSNADKIRSMTDEELAEFLGTRLDATGLCENLEDGCWYTCETRECGYDEARLILKWLKSEVGCE